MCKSKFSTFAIKADYSRVNRIIKAAEKEKRAVICAHEKYLKVGARA